MLILAFGDVHMQPGRASEIPEIRRADCVVVTGDLTIRGGEKEIRMALEPILALAPRVYAQIGNMDTDRAHAWLCEKGINLHGKGVRLGDVGLFGVGGSGPTPFGTPSEFSEGQIAAWLRQAYAEVQGAPFRVLISHTPPFGTAVDQVRGGRHAGSRSVREFLETWPCDVCVCGHIHEAAGTDRLGGCLVLNPGPLPSGGYVRIECDGKALKASLEKL